MSTRSDFELANCCIGFRRTVLQICRLFIIRPCCFYLRVAFVHNMYRCRDQHSHGRN